MNLQLFLCLSVFLLTGQPGLCHRYAGVREAAGLLLVARPDRLLVDERPESGGRRDPLGDVVRRRKVLRGERSGLGARGGGDEPS